MSKRQRGNAARGGRVGLHVAAVNATGSVWPAKRLTIPLIRDTLETYHKRLSDLFTSPKTRVYIDTSFLVWMTALSKEARAELTCWLNIAVPGRVHVPVWAVHEYLRHHTQDLHGSKLRKSVEELNLVADQTFADLKPYLGSPVSGDGRDPEAITSSARATLIEIRRIAGIAAGWRKQHYDENAAEMIKFINAVGLTSPSLLGWMTDIETQERSRFEGRIPPGFQDRGKSAEGKVGSNRFGDLVFWKEILQHAGKVRASGVVIVTNDGKNDWTMAGARQPELDEQLRKVRTDLPPLPRPHPMLEYEASGAAGVTDLMLVDSTYLAIHIRRAGQPANRLFSAAVDIAVPKPDQEDKRIRKEKRDDAKPSSARRQRDDDGHAIGPKHLPVDDSPNMSDAPVGLRMALVASGKHDDPKVGALLERMLSAEAVGAGLDSFLTVTEVKEWTTTNAVWFARALGERSVAGDARALAYATDLLSSLHRLPPRTATALYLGMLAAAYIEISEVGERLRAIPRGPWLEALLRFQSHPQGSPALGAFSAHAKGLAGRPVYLPDAAAPVLAVRASMGSLGRDLPRLNSLEINGVGVLAEPQADEERLISHLFPDRLTVSVGEIVERACSMLGIPHRQVERSELLERQVRFGPTLGLAGASDLQNDMENV